MLLLSLFLEGEGRNCGPFKVFIELQFKDEDSEEYP
jgi:hypothetical protein